MALVSEHLLLPHSDRREHVGPLLHDTDVQDGGDHVKVSEWISFRSERRKQKHTGTLTALSEGKGFGFVFVGFLLEDERELRGWGYVLRQLERVRLGHLVL